MPTASGMPSIWAVDARPVERHAIDGQVTDPAPVDWVTQDFLLP
jgi:hypothetical protein